MRHLRRRLRYVDWHRWEERAFGAVFVAGMVTIPLVIAFAPRAGCCCR